ncbi:hypothetical protein MRX96_006931 [Rhipicephalus microplus]
MLETGKQRSWFKEGFKVDTGAHETVLPTHVFQTLKDKPLLSAPPLQLLSPDGKLLPAAGVAQLQLMYHNHATTQDIYVVATSASKEQDPSEGEAESDEVGQAALSTKDRDFTQLQRGPSCEASFDDTIIQSRSHYVLPSEIPSTAPGPSLHTAADAGSREGTSSEIIYGPGLEKRHRSRSRRRPMDGTKPENTGRAESAERAGRHSKPLEGSSDSDVARRKNAKKSRKGSVGDGLPTASGDQAA